MENFTVFLAGCMILLLLWISFCDLTTGVIPNRLILIGICLNLIDLLWTSPAFLTVCRGFARGMVIALPVLCIVFFMDRLLKRPSMGGGDLKLIFMLGMTTSPVMSLTALLIACLSALLVCMFSGKRKRTALPFGPALCFGWIVVWFFGSFLADFFMWP